MTDLAEIFDELGLTTYLDSFLEQGFDTWETILDITESDFDVLGVKLGHRRKLQRKIAATRGISNAQALASPKRSTPSLEDKPLEEGKGITPKPENKDGNTSNQPSGKRKYRRHPKPDENAPERPPSAYVIFSNKMREDLKGRLLSFTEIAKLVGENWQNLVPNEKEPYEQQAFAAKEKYTIELSEYRQTENYKVYAEYLLDFKAKQLHQQETSQEVLNETSKRPKLENHASINSASTTKSSGTTSSNLSRETSGSRTRVQSSGSMQGAWFPEQTMHSAIPPNPKALGSPGGPSAALPGYRETVIGTNPQTLAWRDQARPTEVPNHAYNRPDERKPSQSGILNGPDAPMVFGQSFHNQQRSIGGFTPPSLTTESAGSTQKSTGSTGSGDSRQNSSATYFAPRTPLEPSRDRQSLPIPAIYSGSKLTGSFDTQLPPIRHPSLSPQSSMNMSYNSPSGILAMDYSSVSQGSQQRGGYFSPARTPHPALQRNACSTDDDNAPLDPVSALIRAGEIVNSQGRQQLALQQLQQQQQQQQQQHHQNQHLQHPQHAQHPQPR